jgi:hypothetical protein
MKNFIKQQVEESELEQLYGGEDNDKDAECECHQACKLSRVYSDEDEEQVIF